MKKTLLLAAVLLSVFSTYAYTAVTVGPYLQSPTPNSIKVMWQTDSLCTVKVMYGTSPGSLTQTATDGSVSNKHMVAITGLSADTKYYYAIYNDTVFAEGDSANHHFRTFPVAGTNTHVRAFAIGDFGKGNSWQQKVRDSYTATYDNGETDLWLWLGDNVYDDGTEQEYLTKVFDTTYGYQKLMKHLPFEPAPGNHDYTSVAPVGNNIDPLQHTGPYYDFVEVYRSGEAGGVPTNHELFYSYDYGNVHFVSLNSEVGNVINQQYDWTGTYLFGNFNGSPMTTWLHADLQANTKPWVVIYFHQPPYTDGSHDSGAFWEVYMKAMRENFAEIWEQYGVDLVICGHSHAYERSYLVKGSYGDVGNINMFNYVSNNNGVDAQGQAFTKYTQGTNANEGTVYVVCGNSGSKDDAPPFNHPYMYSEFGCDTCCGFFILDVDSNRLDGRHIDAYGVERDHFTMLKINGANPNKVEDMQQDMFAKVLVAPNPFSASTKLSFEMKKAGLVKIRLHDATGKLITLFEGELNKGPQQFEISGDKLGLAKGIYSMQLSSGAVNISRSLILQ